MGNTQNKDSSPQGGQKGEEGANETEEEIRESVIDKLELDPDEHEDIIERAVEREKEHKENLGTAIRQKKSWRARAKSQGKDQSGQGDTPSTNQGDNQNLDKMLEKKLNEKLEEQKLSNMNLPDKVEEEVRDLASVKGISMSEAAEHDYIKNLKESVEREERVKNASPSGSKKGRSRNASKDFSKPLNPDDYDLDTDEGRKAWKEDRAKREEYIENKKK